MPPLSFLQRKYMIKFLLSESRSKGLGRCDVIDLVSVKENGMVTKEIKSDATPCFLVRCTFRDPDEIESGMAFDPAALQQGIPLEEHKTKILSPDEMILVSISPDNAIDENSTWQVTRKLSADQLKTLGVPGHKGDFVVSISRFDNDHRINTMTLGDKDYIAKKIMDWLKEYMETGEKPKVVN